MCTIYTIDQKLYSDQQNCIEDQIRQDWTFNREGASLLVGSDKGMCPTFLQTFSLDLTIQMIRAAFADTRTTRIWLHLRSATTSFVNLNGMHGFVAEEYRVFHNGVLSRPESYRLNVDSELIGHDIVAGGIEFALNALQADSFANIMVVDVTNGDYHVTRNMVGSLHTDGMGNYSTYPVGSMIVPVAHNYRKDYVKPKLVYVPYMRDEDMDFIEEYLMTVDSVESLADLAEGEQWFKYGIPVDIYDCFTIEQCQWAYDLGLNEMGMDNEYEYENLAVNY